MNIFRLRFSKETLPDMDRNESKNSSAEYYTIDLLHIAKTLWHKAWIIILVGVLTAAIGFSIAAFAITPMYSSSVMLYVNNSDFALGNTSFNISASEISAAQSLVKTYIVMLQNRTTLTEVIEKADVPYSYGQLSGMIEASAVNETEVLKVKVTTADPYESAKIANCIAEVLPQRISEIIEGSSMEVVDSAVANTSKVSPSITNYTAVGFILGALVAVIILVIVDLMDDTIHDEDYIINTYGYPILAKIPNLVNTGNKGRGYYAQSYRTYKTKESK